MSCILPATCNENIEVFSIELPYFIYYFCSVQPHNSTIFYKLHNIAYAKIMLKWKIWFVEQKSTKNWLHNLFFLHSYRNKCFVYALLSFSQFKGENKFFAETLFKHQKLTRLSRSRTLFVCRYHIIFSPKTWSWWAVVLLFHTNWAY